ncbi:hypothetical protein BKA64DRAFT_646577 [Cadophora sp. MPI-SDFR-AT-0126]|nr:hypothetical protein BKA64DRAFT_646577 [Leotiomycetes sp. MPI-SDFR-AT-0126]
MDRFIYLPEFRVVICKECEPYKLDRTERRRIADEIAEVNGLIGNEEALRRWEFPFPPPTSSPVEGLAKPKIGGFQCSLGVGGLGCNTNKGGRGKKYPVNPDGNTPWRTGVKCQRFFIQGAKSGYFEVQATDPEQIPSRAQIRSRIDQFKAAKHKMEAAFRAVEAKEHREIKEFNEARESNP